MLGPTRLWDSRFDDDDVKLESPSPFLELSELGFQFSIEGFRLSCDLFDWFGMTGKLFEASSKF